MFSLLALSLVLQKASGPGTNIVQVLETALHDGLSDDASEAYAAVRGNSNNDITLKTEEINLSIKSIQVR